MSLESGIDLSTCASRPSPATQIECPRSGSSITAQTKAVLGAMAYAWYVGTDGNERLEAITTTTSVTLTALAWKYQPLSEVVGGLSKSDAETISVALRLVFPLLRIETAIIK
jgi:hypothetical protein